MVVGKKNKPPKYSTRERNECFVCGRTRGIFSKFGLCRIHFRSYALQGYLPGFRKAS